jgi:hypothetical protein
MGCGNGKIFDNLCLGDYIKNNPLQRYCVARSADTIGVARSADTIGVDKRVCIQPIIARKKYI